MTERTGRRAFLRTAASIAAAPTFLSLPRLLGVEEPAKPGSDGTIQLFDGKTLKGWHKNPEKIGHGTGGRWYVEDGAIVGEQDPPGSGNGGILLSDRKFADFEVSIDMNHDWGPCSGFFLRGNDKGQCFQVMVDFHDGGNVGHIYGEGSGAFNCRAFDINGKTDADGRLKELTYANVLKPEVHRCKYTCKPEDFIKAWRIGKWNTLKVRCVGAYPVITTWINGTKICVFDGNTFDEERYDKERVLETLGREGSIAVQVHGGGGWPKGAKVRWKNIKLKELKAG